MQPTAAALSEDDAARRLARDGPNELPEPPPRSPGRIILQQVRDPLILILLAASLISLGPLREYPSGIAILVVVVLNVSIGSAQAIRAESALRALKSLVPPMARVWRSGRPRLILARELVVDDVVEVVAGDKVAADLVLLQASGLAVEEAILTGESAPVDKRAGGIVDADRPVGDRDGLLFSGTLVVRGRGFATVCAVGAATELGRIAKEAQPTPAPPLERELRTAAMRVSAVAVLAGVFLALVVIGRARGDPGIVYSGILAGVALAIAAVPEGLVAIITSALAVGAHRMARRGAIVRQLRAIDTIGRANVLCIDKTGTITEGRLRLAETVIRPGLGPRFWAVGLRCNDSRGDIGDPIDIALRTAAEAQPGVPPPGPRVSEEPFDAATRQMSVVNDADGPILSVKGAPEAVFARCSPSPDLECLAQDAQQAASRGLRVLALADKRSARLDDRGLEPLGLALFDDPLRPDARASLDGARRAGIQVVLVTGDHLETARTVGAKVGLDPTRSVGGLDLAKSEAADRAQALSRASIVARVDPSIKVELVEVHRSRGHVVAMMGDGVNDAPALRRADIGIAVAGAEGSDVAREAAEVVVTRGEIGLIVSAIREGRRIYGNLVSVISYLLAGNISEVIVTLVGLAVFPELVVPLLPAQLLWINLVTDGIPAFALGLDSPPRDPLDAPPRPSNEQLLGWSRLAMAAVRGAWIATLVVGTGVYARRAALDTAQVRTLLFVCLILVHLMLAYVVRAARSTFERGWTRNRVLLAGILFSAGLQVVLIAFQPTRDAFGLAVLPLRAWAWAAAAALAMVSGVDLARWAFRRLTGSARPVAAS